MPSFGSEATRVDTQIAFGILYEKLATKLYDKALPECKRYIYTHGDGVRVHFFVHLYKTMS